MKRYRWFTRTASGVLASGLLASACGDTSGSSEHDATGGGGTETGGAAGAASTSSGGAESGGMGGASGATGGVGGGGGMPTGGIDGEAGVPTGGIGGAGGVPAGGVSGGGGMPTGGVSGDGGMPTGGVSGDGGMPTGGVSGDGGGPTGGVSGDGGSPTGGSAGAGGSDCPASPPADGSPCVPPWEASGGMFPQIVTAHCTWGDDPRSGCRTSALCEDGAWEVTAPAATCADPPPAECGSAPPTPASACSDTATRCWYDDGTRCWCSECVGGSAYPSCQFADPPEWACAKPSADCYPPPQVGSACTDEGTDCGLDCSAPLRCQNGRWQAYYCQSCCPICAAPDTPIATPDGERPIASLRAGDLVYSVDGGAIRAVPLLEVGHTPVEDHRVMRIVLEDGRVLEISPGHPTADGRSFGELAGGSLLDDQHRIVTAELVPYRHDATYDILPASSTGTYFAAGALIGSTLFAR